MRQVGLRMGALLGLAGFWGCSVVQNVTSAGGAGVTGSGTIKSETRPVSGFTGVALSGIGKVVITQNGRESLTVHADDNLLPLLRTSVVDGTLRLETAPNTNLNPTKPIEFDVDARTLSSLDLSGAGDIQANKIEAKALTASLSGAGNMSLSGTVTDLRLTLSGAGSIAGEGLKAQQAVVSNSGTGNVVVNAARQLTITLSGVGNVEYLGAPRVQQNVSGVGRVTQRQ